ncbi:MAG TPA: hypothetical protein ENJ00_04230 [Phycisphaerales bacterium]|nr:hypothetical protein [Phycisphaerales bacterium]
MKRIHALVMGSMLWCSPAPAQPQLVPLGDLPGGPFLSVGSALSGNGLVAVGHSQGSIGLGTSEAFRWTAETGMTGLGRPMNGSSSAANISSNGQYIVGDNITADGIAGIVWAPDGRILTIPDIPGGRDVTKTADVSNTGVVVGSSQYAEGTLGPLSEAFRWTEEGGLQRLGFLNEGDINSTAFAISADGSVIAGRGTSGNWIWTEENGMQATVGNEFFAASLSEDGQSIVGIVTERIDGRFVSSPAMWSEATGQVKLDTSDLPNEQSGLVPRDASFDAEVIFGMLFAQSYSEPYVWFDHGQNGMLFNEYLLGLGLDVEELGYHMIEVSGISDDGTRFLVETFNPNNDREAVLIIVPTPASLALPGLTVLALGRRRRGT